MNTVPNRQIICEVLTEAAKNDREIMVLCSDSRGSASLASFAETLPEQFVEVGIAEQNLVSVAAGLASVGKRPFVASPACFLTTRSAEQIKVDVAYSDNNVKLIGISGGVSYGALGMTHHSLQDIATMSAIPNMRVYLPCDVRQTRWLMEHLVVDDKPAYIRVGRNAVASVYEENDSTNFTFDKSTEVRHGNDVTIIACGEMVYPAVRASDALREKGVNCRVVDMFCVKPLDCEAVDRAARETGKILTVEEHSIFGGLSALICQRVAQNHNCTVKCLALPDEPIVTGNSQEVFSHYGLNEEGLVNAVSELLQVN